MNERYDLNPVRGTVQLSVESVKVITHTGHILEVFTISTPLKLVALVPKDDIDSAKFVTEAINMIQGSKYYKGKE